MCLYSRGKKSSKIIYTVLQKIKMAQGSSKVIESTRMTPISRNALRSRHSPRRPEQHRPPSAPQSLQTEGWPAQRHSPDLHLVQLLARAPAPSSVQGRGSLTKEKLKLQNGREDSVPRQYLRKVLFLAAKLHSHPSFHNL